MGHGDGAKVPVMCFCCGVLCRRAGFPFGKVYAVNVTDLKPGEIWEKPA